MSKWAELITKKTDILSYYPKKKNLSGGKLNSYLFDIDRQAEEIFFRLVKQMAEREGMTEKLKSDNQMEWLA